MRISMNGNLAQFGRSAEKKMMELCGVFEFNRPKVALYEIFP